MLLNLVQKKSITHGIYTTLIAISLSSCGVAQRTVRSQTPTHIDPAESALEVKADRNIADSFLVKTFSLRPSDSVGSNQKDDQKQFQVGISRSALNKEFLLRSNAVQGISTPAFSGLKTRIVAFRLEGSSLFMLEADKGHKFYDSLPLPLILAQFPVTSASAHYIMFDFDAGMKRLFSTGDWSSSDGKSTNKSTVFNNTAIEISYLADAKINSSNQLSVVQIAQLSADTGLKPVKVEYRLEPYQPNLDFIPTKGADYVHMGFFEATPFADQVTGKNVIRASKFDHKKKIRFALSSNTPEAYKAAVREGIEYWNFAFGSSPTSSSKTVIATEAPVGISAPSYEYNVVQWINWDQAGFAFADAQLDPRTGEILNAQVFMTSVFAVSGRSRARKMLRYLKETADGAAPSESTTATFGIKGLSKPHLCQANFTASFAEGLEALLQSNASDSKFMEFSQAYIRDVVAHEIGHTLGLRHNFAGSLAATYGVSGRPAVLKSLAFNGSVPDGTLASSSVMDYLQFEESIVVGTQLLSKSLPYDQAAIRHLYLHERQDPATLPLFCTDSHVKTFYDCNRFDAGPSMIAYTADSIDLAQQKIPSNMIEYFISKVKSPSDGVSPQSFDNFSGSIKLQAMTVFSTRSFALAGLSTGGRLLSVSRKFGHMTELNAEEVQAAHANRILEEISAFNSWDDILGTVLDSFVEDNIGEFDRLIHEERYRTGTGPGGKYTFSDSEISRMKSTFEKFIVKFQQDLLNEDASSLGGVKFLASNEATQGFLTYLAQTSERMLTSSIGEVRVEATFPMAPVTPATEEDSEDNRSIIGIEADIPETQAEISGEEDIELPSEPSVESLILPIFRYSTAARQIAASLLTGSRGTAIDWSLNEKIAVQLTISELLTESLGGRLIETVSPAGLDRTLARFIISNKKVMSGFALPIAALPVRITAQ